MRTYIGLAVILLGLAWPKIEIYLANLKNNNLLDYNKILNLMPPSKEDAESVKSIKEAISGPDEKIDKEKIAIFHNELAKRLEYYPEYTTIDFENFYYEASKNFFEGGLSGKYKGLGDAMYQLVLSTLGENEGIVTREEAGKLGDRLRAMGYVLLN